MVAADDAPASPRTHHNHIELALVGGVHQLHVEEVTFPGFQWAQ